MQIYYWSPFLSHIATINSVINSCASLKKFSKDLYKISIVNSIGEWNSYNKILKEKNISIENIQNINFYTFFPKSGYFVSRLIYIFNFLFCLFPLFFFLKRNKSNFFIIHLLTSLPLFLLIFFNFETKFILRISGYPKLNFFRKILWRLASKKIFKVLCPTQDTCDLLKNSGIFSNEKIMTLYDPVINVASIGHLKKEKIDKYSFSNKRYILSIGRLTKQKNHALLINFFHLLLKKCNDFDLVIIGDGENKYKLLEQIRDLNIENRVYLLGHKKNVFKFIRNAHCVVSTSLWEDPGFVMIETAFLNTIIISSDCPNGPREFIGKDEAGYLFSSNNELSLLNSFNKYLNEDSNIIYNKKIVAKKKSKEFSQFNHYKNLKKILIV